MVKKVMLLISVLFMISLNLEAQTKKAAAGSVRKRSGNQSAVVTYTIIDAPSNTFGYDIYMDGKLLIHQYLIPALPGGIGFATKAKAEKVAKLVILKIKKGEMPPAVSEAEMRKLKAIQ